MIELLVRLETISTIAGSENLSLHQTVIEDYLHLGFCTKILDCEML